MRAGGTGKFACRIKQNVSKKKRRALRVAWMRSLKAGPCIICRREYHPAAMDFHHRPGEKKLFGVSQRCESYSEAAILAEIAKCDLMCSNCHRIETFKAQEAKLDTAFLDGGGLLSGIAAH